MRTFVLFALALSGTAILTDDASAIGKRKRGGSSCGGCGSPVAQTSSCCGGGAAVGGYPGGGMIGSTGMTANGQPTVIRATDGSVYTLGADGSYYPANAGVNTLGGFTSQPNYGGNYRSFYGPGVYPAGGTPPLTMPGVNIPGGGTIVPMPMPPK
jgi:hypothetical protein